MLSALTTFQNLHGRPTLDAPVQPDPTLPLWRVAWEDERTDLHGVGCVTYSQDEHGRQVRTIACYCGESITSACPSGEIAENAAFAELVRHARMARAHAA